MELPVIIVISILLKALPRINSHVIVVAMNRTQQAALGVFVVAIVVVAVYFGGIYRSPISPVTPSTASTTTPAPQQVLDVDYAGLPDTLDPQVSVVKSSQAVYQNIYQSLVYFANNTDYQHMVPVLAERYSFSQDGLTVTFNIRKGITFSNGDPLNAYCIWFSWYRGYVIKQAAGFWYVYYLRTYGHMEGEVTAADLNQLNSPDNMPPQSLIPVITNASHSITVTDPYTVQFHLKGAFPDLLVWITRGQVIDPRAVELHGGVAAGSPNSWVTLNPIGTGPFMLDSWVQGSSAVLVPNPNYWGGPGRGVFPKPKLSKVIIHYVQSETARELDITTGKVQIAAIDIARFAALNGTAGVVLPNIGVTPTWAYLLFNKHLPPLDNILVRQAIVHAINNDEVNKTVYNGLLYGPSVGVTPYLMLGYSADLKQYTYDPDLSKLLLAQAGYPNGKGLPPITYVYPTDVSEGFILAQVIQKDLAAVGITVQLKGMTFGQQLALDFSTPLNSTAAIGIQYTTATPVPSSAAYAGFNFMSRRVGGSGNFVDCGDEVIDALIDQAGSTYDNSLRVRLYQEASRAAYNSYCFYWLGNLKNVFVGLFFFSTKVRGYYYNSAFSMLDFSTIYLSS